MSAASRPRSAAEMEEMRREFGLDVPIFEQYRRYITGVMRGDLGISYSQNRPVWDAIRERIPETALLAVAALIIDYTLGVLLGVFQGTRPKSTVDDALSIVTLTVYSVPVFFLGIVFVVVFSLQLGWFPASGAADPAIHNALSFAGKIVHRAQHLVLPALTLGLVGAAATARVQRVAILDVARQGYVQTARAKGLRERVVLLRHTLRNALLPIVTLFGLSFPMLLSGAVLVESVFAWPGIGRFAAEAAGARDYPAVTGVAIVGALMVVTGNMLADILYRGVDPRTRTAT